MRRSAAPAAALGLAALAVVGLAAAVYSYFTPATGIDGTPGALLVIVSTTLLAGAALLIGFVAALPGWARITLLTLCLLDVLGTGLAAYFLQAWVLLAAMALALLAWLVLAFGGGARREGAFA
ncbi:MAG: hypothetical protein ACK4TR_05520 [Phenylobacterium sp.]|uniref:hypothetical protein n=1 Tax=Phenylobacterium sp. TaxID=1871053 RepID=UPI003918951E